MIKIKVNIKEFNTKNIKLDRDFTKYWRKVFNKYGKLITERASAVHRYKNQTGKLSASNKYRVTANGGRLTVRNTASYSKYVDRWEKSKGGRGWLVKAINYYKGNMRKDLASAPNYIK